MRCRLALVIAFAISVGGGPVVASGPPELIQITHGGTPQSYPGTFGISDDGRRIAWLKLAQDEQLWHLFVANEDGTATREVASISCFDVGSEGYGGISMSGDGGTIAYSSCADPLGLNPFRAWQIFLMNGDGTNLRQLTTERFGNNYDPRLNRDGSVVAYSSRQSYGPLVYTRRVIDSDPVLLDEPPGIYDWRFGPAIDGAGVHVVFQGLSFFSNAFGLRAATVDGTQRHELAPFVSRAAYTAGVHISRDGGTVLYLSSGNLTGENPDNGTFDPYFQAFAISWSGGPIKQITNGAEVAYANGGAQPMVADGSRAALALLFHGYEECSVVWVDTRTGTTEDIFPRSVESCAIGVPEVSADGRVLLFTSNRVTGENPDGFRQVYVLRYGPPPPGGSPPVAAAGPDQVLECVGALSATAQLDGSNSSDPDSTPGTNDDIASYSWSEGGSVLAPTVNASVPFHLGSHDVTLTVTDQSGATGTDGTLITVQDTMPPLGAITAPAAKACFGPATLPVNVTDSFADVCDPTVLRSYDPAPGPSYSQHGDYHVTLTAMDTSSNATPVTVDFTIDTNPPVVELASPAGQAVLLPNALPFNIIFHDSDDDGAAGGVVHEVIKLQGCPIFDGLTYGNEDGLLSDETLTLGAGDLCRAAQACGFTTLTQPVLSVEATDCGGNVGVASKQFTGSIALQPGICGNGRAPLRSRAGANPRGSHALQLKPRSSSPPR